MNDPRFDLPTIEPESGPAWDAAREGVLLIKGCNVCGEAHHYPRPFCPRCWSDDVDWMQASGRATLYTYSVVHVHDQPPFRDRLPYVAAVVDLEEGPRLVTNLVDVDDPTTLEIGMTLEVTFRPLDDSIVAPYFRPAAIARDTTT
jgi:uncharacterized OB-fold protein